MSLRIYNTFTGKKEDFVPLKEGAVGMYLCGPTVYDLGHLGHGFSAVAFDVIRRYLEFAGYTVNFVSNFTDIDDKMIKRAAEKGISVPQLAEQIIPEYEQDYGALGIKPPTVSPRATEYIPEILEIIEGLVAKGYAYRLSDGVYFDVKKFAPYGKLSKQKMDELQSGARVEVNEEKRSPQDFVVWKLSKPGEPVWPSPWGDGRPGWHIECSAMTWKCLGETFDIHAGGADLVFPHHECEIAQTQACFGDGTFARYWLHNGFIKVNNEKMSKSLGNFFLLRDVFKKFSPQVVRFLFLQTHYRSPIDFSDELLTQAENGLRRLHDGIGRLRRALQAADGGGADGQKKSGSHEPAATSTSDASIAAQFAQASTTQQVAQELVDATISKFTAAMDNDFETPVALAVCFDFIKEINRLIDENKVTLESQKILLEGVGRLHSVLGVLEPLDSSELSAELMSLIAQREAARKARDFALSDQLRAQLLEHGIQLEDEAGRTIWKRVV